MCCEDLIGQTSENRIPASIFFSLKETGNENVMLTWLVFSVVIDWVIGNLLNLTEGGKATLTFVPLT